MKIFLLIFLVTISVISVKSQIYLTEGFETGARPDGWTEETVVGDEPWRYRNGGHSPNDNNWLIPPDEEDITRNPPSAYEGTYNAIFFKQGTGNERTKLITPAMDLEGGTKVELSFYLCQVPWTFGGTTSWDVLRVYYKVHQDSSWVLLDEYLDKVYEWELQTLVLPNLSATYYVAFEGHTRWGFGTCIDKVIIEDKGEQHLWIGDIKFIQPLTSNVPSGSSDLPVMRIGIKVFGNTDSAILDHIHFTSLNTSDNDIQTDGVKLYSTETMTFNTENPLGSPINFVSGLANFTDLGYSLPRGQSYLWLTYDVDTNATHKDTLDVMVAANSILANDTLYPSTDQSPEDYRIIYETQYIEDFEGTHNWTLTGEFEVDTTSGMGGSPGNPDPSEAYRGTKVLGTDLTGLGSYSYNYEPGLSESTSYRATSPSIDLFYYQNLNLFYQRYLNIEVWDKSSIQVSTNNGATWNTVWESSSYYNDFQWVEEQIPIPNEYARTKQFKIRYKLGPTDGQNNYSGWNIDDIYVTGEFISKDVGVSKWIYPLSGSGHSATDSVKVRIKNYGGAEITDPVPVAYSFNGGSTWVVDNMTRNIPVDDSVTFTFPTKVDLSTPGLRPSVLAKTMLSGDQYSNNDQISTQIYIVPTYQPPYLEDFEQNDGYWRAMGNDIWEYGTPAGTVIDTAASGTKSWATGLTQKYGDLISRKNQTIFDDDFETDRGWTFTGEFERNQPDNRYIPYWAKSGQYCIGTDLSGQGVSPYHYENGITSGTAYNATSPAFDVTDYTNLSIEYQSYIAIKEGDSIRLEVSPDDGVKWYTLWQNTGAEIIDEDYQFQQFSVHDSLSYTSTLRFRFSLFYSTASDTAEGWNIDDFYVYGDYINDDPGYLTSPSFDLSGLDHPVLEAQLWIETETDVDGATMFYSLDDGDTWSAISNTSGFDTYWNWYTGNTVSALGSDGWSGQSGGWLTARHLLPAAVIGQENVQFKFKFMADMVNNNFDGIAIDDIRVIEAPQDVGVFDILDPVSACELSANQVFTVQLKNYGLESLQPGDSIKIGYYINRAGEIQTGEESIYLTESFGVGTTKDFILTEEFDFDMPGEYYADVFTIDPEPLFYQDTSNDTISEMIKVNKPYVELGPDIYTVRPDTVILNAFSGETGHDYLWQDNSTDSVYHVSAEGTYYVRVTNDLGCVDSDTIQVFQLIADAGVSKWISPQSSCELGDQVPVRIMIKNYGTDTMHVGDQVTAGYIIDSESAVEEVVVLSDMVYPDSTTEYVFSTLADLSAIKTYSVKAYTILMYDDSTFNDTTYTDIEVYGITEIELGDDTVVRALEYTIDAGAGYDTYLWQDGSTNQTLTVDTTGWYKVTVKEGTKCENSDSVHVTIIIPDIAIEHIYNPVTSCGLSSTENLDVYVKNAGSDTLTSNDTIAFTYQINGGTVVFDTLFVDKTVVPGDSILFTSTSTVDLSTPGSYDFIITANHHKDLNPSNDTIEQTIQVYGYPTVSLGPDMIIYTIDTTLDAGAGFSEYLWQDESSDRYYTVNYQNQTPDYLYSVTVTDENGCQASDEIQVTFYIYDIGISQIISPISACILSDQEELKVRIKNYGSRTIFNEKIQIVAIVDQQSPVFGQKTITQAMEQGDSIDFSFGSRFDLSTEGDHPFTVYTVYGKDFITINDTIDTVINHYGYPEPDLGGVNDTLRTSLPRLLDAGAGYDQYIWNGATGSYQLNVYDHGWYKVVVIDAHGCQGTDSVYLTPPTGIDDLNDLEYNLRVYPNPSDNHIYIELTMQDNTDLWLEIFDGTGRKIMIREFKQVDRIRESMDISDLSQGLYYLKVRTKEGQALRKIVIL